MHIKPTQEAGAKFFGAPPEGPVVMLNLLRFREFADYTASPELAPPEPISGLQAYSLYAQHVTPLLAEAGSELVFRGTASSFLIGPSEETWDSVLLVRYVSAAALVAFASDSRYLAYAGHRTAALADSRLLPMTEAV